MAIIKQIVSSVPTIVGQPGTDMSAVNFNAAQGDVYYRVHPITDRKMYPFKKLNKEVGLDFVVPPNRYVTMWTLKPFVAFADTQVANIDYWEPDLVSAQPIFTGPFSLVIPDSGDTTNFSLGSNDVGLLFIPDGDLDLTTVTIPVTDEGAEILALAMHVVEGQSMSSVGALMSDGGAFEQIGLSNDYNVVFDFTGQGTLQAGTEYSFVFTGNGASMTMPINTGSLSNAVGVIDGEGVSPRDPVISILGNYGTYTE